MQHWAQRRASKLAEETANLNAALQEPACRALHSSKSKKLSDHACHMHVMMSSHMKRSVIMTILAL